MKSGDSHKEYPIDEKLMDCFLKGSINGNDLSRAHVSICGGLTAMMDLDDEPVFIEPVHGQSDAVEHKLWDKMTISDLPYFWKFWSRLEFFQIKNFFKLFSPKFGYGIFGQKSKGWLTLT